MTAILRNILLTGATVVVALLGVLLAKLVHMPLPWMLGSLVITMAVSLLDVELFGSRLKLPSWSRALFVPILGIAISSRVTPDVVAGLIHWWPSLLTVIPFVAALQLLNYRLFRSLGGYDKVTAYFSASPGGLVEATLQGANNGGVPTRIVLQHSARVTLSLLFVPWFISALVPAAAARGPLPRDAVFFSSGIAAEFAVLALSAAVAAFMATRFRIPASVMIGPFLVGAVLYATGSISVQVPVPLIDLAQLIIGATLGTRFRPNDRKLLVSSLWMSIVALISSFVLAGATSILLYLAGVGSIPILFMSFSPGGLAEMSMIAVALGADPVFVAAHHMVRIIVTVTISPYIFAHLIAGEHEDVNRR